MNLNGFFLLDKATGITSHSAVQQVKRVLGIRKAGHTGTLDPLASGLLPIPLGEATKFAQFLLDSDKTYWVTARLGLETTTGDIEGNTIKERPIPAYTQAQIQEACQSFLGWIDQVPPMYSALKHQGTPLYVFARRGEEIEREARRIEIKAINFLSYQAPDLELEVQCSKGTYIRVLIQDLGKLLGSGACVSALRRLEHGVFSYQNMHVLSQVQEAIQAGSASPSDYILPMDAALHHLPPIIVDDQAVKKLFYGQSIPNENQAAVSTHSRLYNQQGLFLGIATVTIETILPYRLIQKL